MLGAASRCARGHPRRAGAAEAKHAAMDADAPGSACVSGASPREWAYRVQSSALLGFYAMKHSPVKIGGFCRRSLAPSPPRAFSGSKRVWCPDVRSFARADIEPARLSSHFMARSGRKRPVRFRAWHLEKRPSGGGPRSAALDPKPTFNRALRPRPAPLVCCWGRRADERLDPRTGFSSVRIWWSSCAEACCGPENAGHRTETPTSARLASIGRLPASCAPCIRCPAKRFRACAVTGFLPSGPHST